MKWLLSADKTAIINLDHLSSITLDVDAGGEEAQIRAWSEWPPRKDAEEMGFWIIARGPLKKVKAEFSLLANRLHLSTNVCHTNSHWQQNNE